MRDNFTEDNIIDAIDRRLKKNAKRLQRVQ